MTYKAFLKELGIKLKQQRKKLELNQSELIEKINKGLTKNDDDYLSEKQLSRVECGKSSTRLDKFVRWSLPPSHRRQIRQGRAAPDRQEIFS